MVVAVSAVCTSNQVVCTFITVKTKAFKQQLFGGCSSAMTKNDRYGTGEVIFTSKTQLPSGRFVRTRFLPLKRARLQRVSSIMQAWLPRERA